MESPRPSSKPVELARGAAEGKSRGVGARFKNLMQTGKSGTQRTTFFPLMDQVRASKRAGRAWLNLLKTKTSDEDGVLSPYMQWLEESESFEAQPRQAWFHTIGKAPLEAPVRPARLTPVRQMSPTPEPTLDGQGSGPAGNVDSGFAESPDSAAQDGGSPTGTAGPRTIRRTFSRECCRIMRDQSVVMPFDAMKIYLACSFFAPCSISFLRELLIVGGAAAWQGQSMNSGCTVYDEGDLGASMFVVARGTAEVLKEGKSAQELGVGAHFGEAQVLGILSRRLETVKARSSLHILEITPSTLTKLLKRAKAEDDVLLRRDSEEMDDDEHEELDEEEMRGAGIGRALRLGGNAFAEERRHFEGEAVRLYRDHVGESHRERPCPSASAGGDRSRLGRTTKAYLGKLAGLEELDPDRGASPDRSKEQEAPTQYALKRSLRGTGPTPSSRYVSGDADGGSDFFSAGGDRLENSASSPNTRERLVTHLVQSLRTDMRRGYMMPADSLGGAKRRYASSKSKSKKSIAKRSISVSGSLQPRRRGSTVCSTVGDGDLENLARQLNDEADDDEARDPVSAPLDIQMLPPIGLLSPAQKHGLLQQLRSDARAKVTHLLVTPGRKDRLESMAMLLRRETRFQLETRFEFDTSPGASFCVGT